MSALADLAPASAHSPAADSVHCGADAVAPSQGERHVQVQMPTGTLSLQVLPPVQSGAGASGADSFSLDELAGFAARTNSRRGFLFLSKVLGKHWPVSPGQMGRVHRALTNRIPADLPGPIIFMALAETGIGLGQGVFEQFLQACPAAEAVFLHTTRYRTQGCRVAEFSESHSHAPRQFFHLPRAGTDAQRLLAGARSLVLIDDEASTGDTFCNLSAELCRLAPGIERVHLLTLTNFMGMQTPSALHGRFGVPASAASLLLGRFTFAPASQEHGTEVSAAQKADAVAVGGASNHFGRLGLTGAVPTPAELARQLAADIAPQERVLVLGTGEFMHPAYLLARELETRGTNVVVQATTRSPIRVWGAVSSALRFADNYGEGIDNYLYNVTPGQYQHILICHETPPNAALHHLAALLGGRLVYFRNGAQVEEVPVRRS